MAKRRAKKTNPELTPTTEETPALETKEEPVVTETKHKRRTRSMGKIVLARVMLSEEGVTSFQLLSEAEEEHNRSLSDEGTIAAGLPMRNAPPESFPDVGTAHRWLRDKATSGHEYAILRIVSKHKLSELVVKSRILS